MILLPILVTAISSAQLTRLCVIKMGLSPIRSSSVLTLVFVVLTQFFVSAIVPTLQAAFLGATFVGMSEPEHMSVKRLFVASIIFSFIFFYLIPHARGLGGALGCAAFVSCMMTILMRKFLSPLLPK